MRRRASMLVGRDDEVRVLRDLLRAAGRGRGRAVFIVGDSGVGKTRLASAVADLAFESELTLLRGRSSAIDLMVPFRPLTEALLSLQRSRPVDPAELGPYGPVLGRLIPDWRRPSGNDGGEDAGSLVVLAEAVLRLLGVAGRGRGCLLTLDDVQDADAETLAVVEYLIDNLDQQSTLLVGTMRPEQSAALTIARSAAQRGQAVLLELGPLRHQDLRAMTGSCLGVDGARLPDAAIDLLWAGSAGNPFLIEELVAGMVDRGLLVCGPDGWTMTDRQPAELPSGFARGLATRTRAMDPQARRSLELAAVLGQRFPLDVVQAATGATDRELLSHLHGELAGQLVSPDEQTPNWYAFRHRLSREGLLANLSAGERGELAATAASAVAAVRPGLPGQWCQLSASLYLDAGRPREAGRLFAEAGRRALAEGAASSAVTLLTKARGLLAGADGAAQAEVLEALIHALAETGEVDRALAMADQLDETGMLDPRRRAHLHTRLAWAAEVAGRAADAVVQVDTARALLGPDAAAEDTAPIDVVAAHLALDVPGQDQLRTAEELARRAATVAESVPLPVVMCQSWQLLGALVRHRDPDAATEYLERARSVAARHNLPIWEIHSLIRLGNDDALRHGGLDRLTQARAQATRVGAVTARYQAESSIALHSILRGDHATATTLIDQVFTATSRLKLLETVQYVLLLRTVQAAHQGRRQDMDDALAEFARWSGDGNLHAPRIHGLAGSFCALLEENRPRAVAELAKALDADRRSPTVFHLAGRYGLQLLLRAVSGELDRVGLAAVSGTAAGALRWDRQFALFAEAVLAGRDGAADEAAASVDAALRAGEPYPMGRNLGLRLACEAALADGWGEPVEWLRLAEDHFHRTGVPAVAGACRALLRQAGVRVAHRHRGADDIPPTLRSAGVTVREFEVLRLLVNRLANREIAERLHLSHRTVERHVSSLITKTGLPNRLALSEFASAALTA